MIHSSSANLHQLVSRGLSPQTNYTTLSNIEQFVANELTPRTPTGNWVDGPDNGCLTTRTHNTVWLRLGYRRKEKAGVAASEVRLKRMI